MKNLLESWESWVLGLVDKKIILFLDYDGTLAPIAPIPSQAILPQENKVLLEGLEKHTPQMQLIPLNH